MKNLILSFVLMLSVSLSSVNASAEIQNGFVTTADGRDIYVETNLSSTTSQRPLMIFVNGLVWKQEGYRQLMESVSSLGIDSVSMSFSLHPESLQNKNGFHQKVAAMKETSLDDLANEILTVVRKFRKPNQKVIVTTLSYSGGVLPSVLKKSADLVDEGIAISPLGVPGESDPASAAAGQTVELMLGLNPFAGPFLVGSLRQAYTENYITAALRSRGPGFLPANVSLETARSGLVRLVLAADNFDLRKAVKNLPKNLHMILGTGESEQRLSNQLEAFSIQRQQSNTAKLALIPDAPHVTFAESSKATAQMLSLLTFAKLPTTTATFVYSERTESFASDDSESHAELLQLVKKLKQ
ncbi:MAG: hypothetical protein V4736_01230 [Bdellovibrionota bacterium]